MITIYWSYKGYCGDKFYGDVVGKTAAEYAPNSRSVSARVFSWLNQRGFGQGYFNNSGVYVVYRKSVFKTEADRDIALALMTKSFNTYTHTVFSDDVAYYDALAATKLAEKRLRKQNPY
jgi:hypothetical protein